MVKLDFIEPKALTAEDVRWIRKAIQKDKFVGVSEIVELLLNGNVGVLRVTGKAKGVLIYQQTKHANGSEIFVWKVAGKRILSSLPAIVKQLEMFAKTKGCDWIGCSADHDGSKRMIERKLKLKPVSVMYRKEIDHGTKAA